VRQERLFGARQRRLALRLRLRENRVTQDVFATLEAPIKAAVVPIHFIKRAEAMDLGGQLSRDRACINGCPALKCILADQRFKTV